MSVSGVSISVTAVYTSQAPSSSSSRYGCGPGRAESDDGSGRVRDSRGNSLFASLLSALQQIVSGQNAPPPAGDSTTGPTDTTTPASDQRHSLRQDLHRFLDALFTAVRDANTAATAPTDSTDTPATPATDGGTPTTAATTPATPATTTHAYQARGLGHFRANFVSGLQALVQQLQASSDSNGLSEKLSRLDSAFQRLISDLKPASSDPASSDAASSTSSQPSLLAFLQLFLQNLQGSTDSTPSPVGATVNTTA